MGSGLDDSIVNNQGGRLFTLRDFDFPRSSLSDISMNFLKDDINYMIHSFKYLIQGSIIRYEFLISKLLSAIKRFNGK